MCFGNVCIGASFSGRAKKLARSFAGIPRQALIRVLAALKMDSAAVKYLNPCSEVVWPMHQLVTAEPQPLSFDPSHRPQMDDTMATASIPDQWQLLYRKNQKLDLLGLWTCIFYFLVRSKSSAVVAASSCTMTLDLFLIDQLLLWQSRNAVHLVCTHWMTRRNQIFHIVVRLGWHQRL